MPVPVPVARGLTIHVGDDNGKMRGGGNGLLQFCRGNQLRAWGITYVDLVRVCYFLFAVALYFCSRHILKKKKKREKLCEIENFPPGSSLSAVCDTSTVRTTRLAVLAVVFYVQKQV